MKKYGIRKAEIIRKSEKFSDLFSNGAKISSRHIVLFYNQGSESAVGFATSRGIGSMVNRNRARRILRELYRLNREELNSTVEMIMLAREGILGAPFERLSRDVIELFHRIRSN